MQIIISQHNDWAAWCIFPSWHEFKSSIWMETGLLHSEMSMNSQFPLSCSCWIVNFPSVASAAPDRFLHARCCHTCPWCAALMYVLISMDVYSAIVKLSALFADVLRCHSAIILHRYQRTVLVVETYFIDKSKSHHTCCHRTMFPISLALAHQRYPCITSDWLLCHLSCCPYYKCHPLLEITVLD